VLDDQQQEAIIEDISKECQLLRKRSYLFLKFFTGSILAFQLLGFLSNPMMAIFPVTVPDASLPMPMPAVFGLLTLFIYFNAALHLPGEARNLLPIPMDSLPTPFSFRVLYCLSCVAPTFSFLLNKPWQTTIWWCVTPFVVLGVQTFIGTLQSTSDAMARLEKLKYNAPGA